MNLLWNHARNLLTLNAAGVPRTLMLKCVLDAVREIARPEVGPSVRGPVSQDSRGSAARL